MTNTVGDTTTNFFYSSAGQVLEEQSGGLYTQRYVWSPNYVNEMIFRDTDTSETGLTPTGESYTRLWAVQDANYNVVALLNNSGTVVERYDYDPFGAVTVMSSSYTVEDASSYNWVYGFQGMRLDAVTGQNESRSRLYTPPLGVWTSPDPSGLGPDVNDYRFVQDEPIRLTDPSGLDSVLTTNNYNQKTLGEYLMIQYLQLQAQAKLLLTQRTQARQAATTLANLSMTDLTNLWQAMKQINPSMPSRNLMTRIVGFGIKANSDAEKAISEQLIANVDQQLSIYQAFPPITRFSLPPITPLEPLPPGK